MEAVEQNPDINNRVEKELEEKIARKLCQVAGLDPDGKHYLVHPSHYNLYWPMWKVFRPDAEEIIAMVQAAGVWQRRGSTRRRSTDG